MHSVSIFGIINGFIFSEKMFVATVVKAITDIL